MSGDREIDTKVFCIVLSNNHSPNMVTAWKCVSNFTNVVAHNVYLTMLRSST